MSNSYQNHHQEAVALSQVAANLPPDVTNQTNDNKPDLIQDVTQDREQPDLTKGGGEGSRRHHQDRMQERMQCHSQLDFMTKYHPDIESKHFQKVIVNGKQGLEYKPNEVMTREEVMAQFYLMFKVDDSVRVLLTNKTIL